MLGAGSGVALLSGNTAQVWIIRNFAEALFVLAAMEFFCIMDNHPEI